MVKLAFPIREVKLDYTVNGINIKSWHFKKKKGRFGSLLTPKAQKTKRREGKEGRGGGSRIYGDKHIHFL